MNITSRSYLTAGVAALSVGAIALTPVQPMPNQLVQAPEHAVSTLAVDLAAAVNPIENWVNAIDRAVANAYALQDAWNQKPFPILQTIVQNQFTYLSELPNIGVIVQQIVGNIGNAIRAPFTANPDNIDNTTVVATVPVLGALTQRRVWDLLPVLLPKPEYDALKPILDLTTTPISGFLLGFAGPGLSSILQIQETIQNILKPPPGSRFLANAINEIINLPANLFNAAWNGGKYLDLTNIVDALAPLPASIKSIGIQTGGFLNAGGPAFNALAADATALGVIRVEDPGVPVGFIGATGSLANAVANAIKVTLPQSSAAVAAAAAADAPEVKAVEAASKQDAPEVSEAEAPASVTSVVSEAPAPKRQSRAARAAGGSDNGGHATRGRAARPAS